MQHCSFQMHCLLRRILKARLRKRHSTRLERVSRPLYSETSFATLTSELIGIRLIEVRVQSYATNGQKKGRMKNCTSLEPREMAEVRGGRIYRFAESKRVTRNRNTFGTTGLRGNAYCRPNFRTPTTTEATSG